VGACPEGKATATHCNTLQHAATHCKTLQRTATNCKHCNTLQHNTIALESESGGVPRRQSHCNTLQHAATSCNALQQIVTHCNSLQHTATQHNSTGERKWGRAPKANTQFQPKDALRQDIVQVLNMYMYIHMYIYMCICINLFMCICMSMYTCTCIWMCVRIYFTSTQFQPKDGLRQDIVQVLDVYTYIHMYICICSYVCYTVVWYIIPSIHLYVYTYVHIHMYIYICIYIHHIQEGFGQEVLLSLCILVHIYMCILRLSPTHKGMGESFSLVIFLNLDTYTRLSMCLNIYTSEPCRHRHG